MGSPAPSDRKYPSSTLETTTKQSTCSTFALPLVSGVHDWLVPSVRKLRVYRRDVLRSGGITLYPFLTSTLDGSELTNHALATLFPRKHLRYDWIGVCVDPRAGLVFCNCIWGLSLSKFCCLVDNPVLKMEAVPFSDTSAQI